MGKNDWIGTIIGIVLLFLILGIAYIVLQEPSVNRGVVNPPPTTSQNVVDYQPHVTQAPTSSFLGIALCVLVFGVIDLAIFWWARRVVNQVCNDNKLSAQIKLKRIESEGVLFDLPLYLGLLGTVFGFLGISMGWSFVSRDVAYVSTVVGILASALMRVCFLRPKRNRLLEDCAKN